MAVFDPSWLRVWWPWLLVWFITPALLIAAGAIAVTHRRNDRWRGDLRRHGISFYLDGDAVMDIYLQRDEKYKGALRQEVEERISSNNELKLSVDLAPVEGGGKRGVNREVFSKYIREDEPITVIGIIIDVLEQAGDIVHVDLRKQEVIYDRALEKALDTDDDERPTAVRLRGLDTFVSIRGRFQATTDGRATGVTTLEAPYGDPTTPGSGPRVHLGCTASGLRGGDVPAGSFPARCLGRVQDWDPNTSTLIVRPIAIFN